MSIAPKPVIAASLLLGVTAVWVPRLTGFDPFGWLPDELPTSSEIPSSGADPHAVGADRPTDTPGTHDADDAGSGGEAQQALLGDTLPLRDLQDVVRFLEQRGEAPGARGRALWPVDEAGPGAADGDYVQEIERLAGGTVGRPDEVARGASPFAEELQLFLHRSPLHTIIEGAGLTTATFGYQRVAPGDTLLDERARVTAIDLTGVVLETPDGPLRIHLPPPGQRTFSRRERRPLADDDVPADPSED